MNAEIWIHFSNQRSGITPGQNYYIASQNSWHINHKHTQIDKNKSADEMYFKIVAILSVFCLTVLVPSAITASVDQSFESEGDSLGENKQEFFHNNLNNIFISTPIGLVHSYENILISNDDFQFFISF